MHSLRLLATREAAAGVQSLNRIAPDLSTTKKVPSIRLMMSVKLAVMTCEPAER